MPAPIAACWQRSLKMKRPQASRGRAPRLVRWAADIRYPDRAEELEAVIDDRPGKLFKLFTASGFVCAALVYHATRRRAAHRMSRARRLTVLLSVTGLTQTLFPGQLAFINSALPETPFLAWWATPPLKIITICAVLTIAADLLTQFALMFPELRNRAAIGITLSMLAAATEADLTLAYDHPLGRDFGVDFPFEMTMATLLTMLPTFWLMRKPAPRALLVGVTIAVVASTAGVTGLAFWLNLYSGTTSALLFLADSVILGLAAGACAGVSGLIISAMKERWRSTTPA